MNKHKLLLLCLLFLLQRGYAQTTTMSLNSTNPEIVWEIKPQADLPNTTGEQISRPGFMIPDYVKGVVPGVVFTAYVEAGIIPDPNYADNIYKVDETYFNRPFWYRTEFKLPASYSTGRRVWLHFDNTNRFADFYFNGKKLSGTKTSTKDVSGHMIRTQYDVTDLVNTSGINAVAVLITDADQKKTREAKDPYGVACSPSYLAGAGWDWMPYVPGRLAGITGNAYLSITGDAVMEDPWVRSELPTLQKAELSISTDIKNTSSGSKDMVVSGVIQPGNIRFSKNLRVGGKATSKLMMNKDELSQLVINNPKLWWPNGYGEPNLYTCKLTCSIDGKVSDEKEMTFGIKKYEYKTINNVVGYPVLTFFINGQKLYLKGGNWGMSEYLLRCHGKEYETKIKLHKDMNYNMIRLWTGCVTDDEFYDYCDQYGMMVWNDFWLYVAYNDVAQPEAFKANALDKVKRLRNHPSIAIWCGANETHPAPDLDNYLREMIAREDLGDRMYKSCSNQDGLSGSGWWGNQPPKHHFDTSGSNLAFNKPAYPYGVDHGYGMRTEIGTATFPTFESVKKFIPQHAWWPLPTDEQLKNEDDNVWNKHFFGKEASNANPINYKNSVNTQYGESSGLEEFCEKAQLLNIEVMKGMYEAWNDKMWNDAAGLLIWMSHPAYPSFVWQTYDYYYEPTGAYWGAKKACEPLHIQWNASNNSIKVINTTSQDLKNAIAKATIYNLHGKELTAYRQTKKIDVSSSNIAEAFVLNFNSSNENAGKKGEEWTPLHFIKLELTDSKGHLISDNFYWRNGTKELDYTSLNELPAADVSCKWLDKSLLSQGKMKLELKNKSGSVAFANRIQLVNKTTKERVLPVFMSDNYITLMPGEKKIVSVAADPELLKDGVEVLIKQYGKGDKSAFRLAELKCENLVNPLGIDNATPHFSWKLQDQELKVMQRYYEIQVASDSLLLTRGDADLWDSGKVKSDASVMVPYQGKTLESRSLGYWRVRAWNQKGKPSEWSPIARFGIGILNNELLHGSYIGLPAEAGKVCAPILRKKLNVSKIQTTFLHINTLGYHEIYVNGQKVGNDVLSPAVSQLTKRSLILTYDVTPYLKAGENDLVIWLGQGWYKKSTFGAAHDGPLVKAELNVLENGKWKLLAETDTSWNGRESGYSDTGNWCALQFGGERVDGRILPTDLSTQTLDKMKWYPVIKVNVPDHIASPQMCETNVIHRITEPVSVKKVTDNTWLVDMGRVLTGWFEISLPQLPEGQEVTMEYSDNLNKEGEFDKQGESDIYISAGRKGECFRNKFNHHAYRYVRISNLPVTPETGWMKGLQMYGDFQPTTTFECSDTDLNAIHQMIQYTMKCLTFSGYMVDCPHLERAGYGGDGNSSTMSLQTMYDVAPTFMNWIQAWGDSMREGGSLPHVGPNPGAGGGGPYWCGFMVQAPWRTYLNYNDARLIERYYPQMKEWFKYVDRYTVDGLLKRWPDLKYRDWYLGDWLAPMGVDAGNQASVDLVNNCFISECLGSMQKMATLLGKPEEAQAFAVRKEKLNKLIHHTFYRAEEGIYATGSQLDMCYPVLVGAVPEELYDKVKENMMTITEQKHNGHIAVGLVGVPIFTEWCTRNKAVDFMYQILKKRDYPGYLNMIDHGATATWEYWSGERSRVHNCYNGIGTWFYQAVGGISLDESAPGYRHAYINPQIPNGVTWAKVTKETPYGTMAVNWELKTNQLEYQVTIPSGATATVLIPTDAISCRMDGKKLNPKVKSVKVETGRHHFVFDVDRN